MPGTTIALRLEKSFKKFYGRYQGQSIIHSQDNLYFTYSRILVVFVVYMDLSLGFADALFDC